MRVSFVKVLERVIPTLMERNRIVINAVAEDSRYVHATLADNFEVRKSEL